MNQVFTDSCKLTSPCCLYREDVELAIAYICHIFVCPSVFCPCTKRVLHTKMMTCNSIMMIIEKIITDNMAITNMASKGRLIAKKI